MLYQVIVYIGLILLVATETERGSALAKTTQAGNNRQKNKSDIQSFQFCQLCHTSPLYSRAVRVNHFGKCAMN